MTILQDSVASVSAILPHMDLNKKTIRQTAPRPAIFPSTGPDKANGTQRADFNRSDETAGSRRRQDAMEKIEQLQERINMLALTFNSTNAKPLSHILMTITQLTSQLRQAVTQFESTVKDRGNTHPDSLQPNVSPSGSKAIRQFVYIQNLDSLSGSAGDKQDAFDNQRAVAMAGLAQAGLKDLTSLAKKRLLEINGNNTEGVEKHLQDTDAAIDQLSQKVITQDNRLLVEHTT